MEIEKYILTMDGMIRLKKAFQDGLSIKTLKNFSIPHPNSVNLTTFLRKRTKIPNLTYIWHTLQLN